MRTAAVPIILFLILALSSDAAERREAFVPRDILEGLSESYGAPARLRGERLNRLFAELRTADVATQIREVNRFFNQFSYRTDPELWGQADYWSTPWEFLGRNAGDCEDFVIAKYFVLRALGIGDDHLYLTYVKAVRQNVAHMVLSYFETTDDVPLVLDNYNPAILPATERTDLIPVYSFNAESLFLAKSAGLGQALPDGKLKNRRWEQLLENFKGNKL